MKSRIVIDGVRRRKAVDHGLRRHQLTARWRSDLGDLPQRRKVAIALTRLGGLGTTGRVRGRCRRTGRGRGVHRAWNVSRLVRRREILRGELSSRRKRSW